MSVEPDQVSATVVELAADPEVMLGVVGSALSMLQEADFVALWTPFTIAYTPNVWGIVAVTDKPV